MSASLLNIPKLGVAFPRHTGEYSSVTFPLALPIWWTSSPPYFSAFAGTIVDVANSRLVSYSDPPPYRLDKAAATLPPPPASTPRKVFYKGVPPSSSLPPTNCWTAPPCAKQLVKRDPLSCVVSARQLLPLSSKHHVAPLLSYLLPARQHFLLPSSLPKLSNDFQIRHLFSCVVLSRQLVESTRHHAVPHFLRPPRSISPSTVQPVPRSAQSSSGQKCRRQLL
jgi:hypothetical protein